MTISNALYTSFSGLRHTESQINVTSQNVTNADKAGYTRKELASQYITTNAGTVPISSLIETVNYNPYMLKSLVEDSSVAYKNTQISKYLSAYAKELGSIAGDNSISAFVDDFAAAMSQLSITPEDTALKNQVIATADRVARELNNLSATIQETRLTLDKQIEVKTKQVNQLLEDLDAMNKEFTKSEVLGKSTANLVDERNVALEKLSQLINIEYFVNSQNQLHIYSGQRPLLDSRARSLEYTAATAIDKNVVYPGSLPPIELDGYDITPFTTGGELGGLLALRDTNMVEEQAKLDEFASGLMSQMNGLLNQGSSLPARSTLVGDTAGLAAGDALGGATGTFRIAMVNSDGVVQNAATLNLAGFATVGDLIAGINAAMGPDMTASLTANGELRLSSNIAGQGIALNQMTSNFPSGESMSAYFGLNNMFSGNGADNIEISSYLVNNGLNFAASRLDATATVGQKGLFSGDASLVNEMHDAFTSAYSFAAAGNFAAQSDSLTNYIDNLISDVAYRASNAETTASIAQSLMDQTKSTLENMSGVNIDEEMANLIDLEAKYEASATMIKTLQDMFDTLLGAVR